jgi:hypothetical protein
MTLVSWPSDGHAEIFVKTTSGTMQHTYTNGDTDTWAPFGDLDTGSTCGAAALFWPTAGFTELFDAAPDGSPQHLWWHNYVWSKWAHDMMSPKPLAHFSTLVWGDGHADVLALGGDGAIWHTSFAQGGTAWPAWQSLGGSFATGATAILWADGHAELFATDAAGAAWHAWSGTGADFPNGWHAWASLGGSLTSRPVPVRWADGHLEIFATGTDGQLYHADYANGAWPAFSVLSPGTKIVGEPTVIMNGGNQGATPGPEIWARDPSGMVQHMWWTGMGYNTFSPHQTQIVASDPFAWLRYDGKAELFAIDTMGQLVRSWHDGGNGWTNWAPIGGMSLDPCLPPVLPPDAGAGAGGSGTMSSGTGGAGTGGSSNPGAKGGCRCALESRDNGAWSAIAACVALLAASSGRRRRSRAASR